MSEVAPTREIPTEPQGKAELKIAIGAECGLDLRQRIATTGSAPASVMFRQDTLVRIAIRLPNSRGDARNPRNLTCPELREWIAKAVGEEPPGGQFRWVHLKRIYEALQEREVRADGGTEQTGTERSEVVEIDVEHAETLLEAAASLRDDIASGRIWGEDRVATEENASDLEEAYTDLRDRLEGEQRGESDAE